MLSVGRFTRRKGLAEFAERCLPQVLARFPEARLLVVGDEASDALHGATGSERERIQAAARVAGVEQALVFAGRCEQAELDAAYEAAQVHVFPVIAQRGDVEGFGMVALESAAHGLRTVAFAVGGIPDAVADQVTGRLVEAGDYPALAKAVTQTLAAPLDAAGRERCRAFARGKDWTAFGRRLRALLEPRDGST
jgi:phosphatidylinositol alpha-1,6-mannosyltransferase